MLAKTEADKRVEGSLKGIWRKRMVVPAWRVGTGRKALGRGGRWRFWDGKELTPEEREALIRSGKKKSLLTQQHRIKINVYSGGSHWEIRRRSIYMAASPSLAISRLTPALTSWAHVHVFFLVCMVHYTHGHPLGPRVTYCFIIFYSNPLL